MENSVISIVGYLIANWFRRAKFRAATAQQQGIFRLTGGKIISNNQIIVI